MTIILVLFVSSGLLLAAVARPLMLRKVQPNSLYGFRVRKTLEDPKVWYDANEFAGKCMFRSGVATALACAILYFVSSDPLSYVWDCVAIAMCGLALSLFLSFRFLKRC